jgi:phosphoribosyl-ATP pyrophosphohydrolase
MGEPMSAFTLEDLAKTIAARARAGDPASSYTAKLLAEGVEKCARKFGEEAAEATIAAISQSNAALTAEAGDVLYHLLVMLQARGISLSAVMAELEQRTGQSGLAEKAGRK